MTRTRVFADPESAAEAASALVLEAIRSGLAEGRDPAVVLPGGRTPRDALRMLSRSIQAAALPVERILWLLGDERWVGVDSPRSNEGMARETLLAAIGAPERTIVSWHAGAGDPREAARTYGSRVERVRLSGGPDVVLLGLGADGHTASLFAGATVHLPGGGTTEMSADLPCDAAAVYLPGKAEWRLTLCPSFLRTAREVAFLVAGADKRSALRRATAGDPAIPGSWIRGCRTTFLVTEETVGPGLPDYGGQTRFA